MAHPSLASAESQITLRFSDSILLGKKEVLWSEHGVSLATKWYFAQGAEIEIGVICRGKRHRCSGIVVSCEKKSAATRGYQTLVYCLKAPCPRLRAAWQGTPSRR